MWRQTRIDLIYYTFLRVISIRSYFDFCKNFKFSFYLLFIKQKSNLSKIKLSWKFFYWNFCALNLNLITNSLLNFTYILREIGNFKSNTFQNEYLIILASWLRKQMARVPKQFKSRLETAGNFTFQKLFHLQIVFFNHVAMIIKI